MSRLYMNHNEHSLPGRIAEGIITRGYWAKVGSTDSSKCLVANTDDLCLGVVENTLAVGDNATIFYEGAIVPVYVVSAFSAGQLGKVDSNGATTVCTSDGDVARVQILYDADALTYAVGKIMPPTYIGTLADLH